MRTFIRARGQTANETPNTWPHPTNSQKIIAPLPRGSHPYMARMTVSTRQTTGFVESLFRLIGLDWDVPDSSTLSRRQKTLAVNIPHRGSQGPLHLLIDSTGIKVEGEGASMAAPGAASGARSTSGLMSKRWRSGRSRSPGATWARRPCCRSCSARSVPNRRSQASPPTGPKTRASATTPSPNAGPMP
jgi:hypothetical protein